MRAVPSEQYIESQHQEAWEAMIKKYGSQTKVPKEIAQSISDRGRALHGVRQATGEASLAKALRALMIPEPLVVEMVAEYGDGEKIEIDESGNVVIQKSGKKRRGDAEAKIEAWCKANPYAMTSVKALCEIGECAHMKVRKVLSERTDLFKQGEKKGVWEVRNVAEERKADKR